MSLADERPSTLPPGMVALYEARALHDLATFHCADYLPGGHGRWVIAQIRPDPGSGAATVPGGYVDGDTGTLVTPPEAEAVLVKKGQWQTLAAASPTAGNGGRYEWHEPLGRHLRMLEPADLYSPFVYGGCVVFTLTAPNEHGRPFGAIRLLPPGWVDAVTETLRQAPPPHPLDPPGACIAPRSELPPLLAGANPLSAILAFRELLQRPDAAPAAATALRHADPPRKLGALAYLALTAPADDDRGFWDAQLAQVLADTASPERLLALGHAALAVTLFQSGHPPAFHAAGAYARALRTRVHHLRLDTADDPSWQRIFSAVG